MKINCHELGKRFNRDWIFRRFSYQFITGKSYAVTGPNGSGKSTLLQILAGAITHSEGTVTYIAGDGRVIEPDLAFRQLTWAAPYLDVIEEMTGIEFLRFHNTFKPFLGGRTAGEILTEIGLHKAADQQIRYYSSGMKQRVKLAQAFFSDTPLLLLDEPCTNFDEAGYALYYDLLRNYTRTRLVIVSSNDKKEYDFCDETIGMMELKA